MNDKERLQEAAVKLAMVIDVGRAPLVMTEVSRREAVIADLWLRTPIRPPHGATPAIAAIESVYYDVCRGVL
jgi:hypothetical protein